jgi:hypothetical protein
VIYLIDMMNMIWLRLSPSSSTEAKSCRQTRAWKNAGKNISDRFADVSKTIVMPESAENIIFSVTILSIRSKSVLVIDRLFSTLKAAATFYSKQACYFRDQ